MSSDARKARKSEGVQSDCEVRGEVRRDVTKGAHAKCASSLTVHQLRRQQEARAERRVWEYCQQEQTVSKLMQM